MRTEPPGPTSALSNVIDWGTPDSTSNKLPGGRMRSERGAPSPPGETGQGGVSWPLMGEGAFVPTSSSQPPHPGERSLLIPGF